VNQAGGRAGDTSTPAIDSVRTSPDTALGNPAAEPLVLAAVGIVTKPTLTVKARYP